VIDKIASLQNDKLEKMECWQNGKLTNSKLTNDKMTNGNLTKWQNNKMAR
jgi:hypothetical protein